MPPLGVSQHSVIQVIHLAHHPFALAMDAATHRVFVLNSDDPAYLTGLNKYPNAIRLTSVSVLNAATGAVVHTVPLRGYVPIANGTAAVAVDARSGRVVLALSHALPNAAESSPGTVRMLDGTTGAVLRRVPVGSNLRALAVDARTRRVFVSGDRDVRVLDLATGALLRIVPGGGSVLAVDARSGQVFLLGGPGVVVLGATTGTVRKTIALDPAAAALALAVDGRAGRVVVGLDYPSRLSSVAVLDAATGRLVRQTDQAGAAPLVVDAATGRAFAVYNQRSSTNGPVLINVLDTPSGRLLKTVVADPDASESVMVAEAVGQRVGRIFVIDQDYGSGTPSRGYVVSLDARSGSVRGSVLVGHGNPVALPALAVDDVGKRVFVANPGDQTITVLDAARL